MTDPFDPSQRKTLFLKRGRERAVANRHPWIFAGAIERESGPADAAIADLIDASGKRVASGFHSRHSQIRLRALTFGDEELTAALLRARIAAAIRRRLPLLRSSGSSVPRVPRSDSAEGPRNPGTEELNAVRLIHSEGDELSGLIVDKYNDVMVVEIANEGLDRLKQIVIDGLGEPRLIYFKNDIPARRLEQIATEPEIVGKGVPATTIIENDLRFHVDPAQGQKTGFFLDQRENRALVRQLARGKRVLNLFSYSGAFGVYAAAGGAASVENVDISAPAIDGARANHELNGLMDGVRFTVADAFSFVRSCREQFDLIVCDPPAFAKSRGEVERAARGYKDVNLFAMKLLAPGGTMLTFSCSGHMSLDLFQKVIFAAALDAGRRLAFVRRLTAGPDHPVSLYCPESEYLKGFCLKDGG